MNTNRFVFITALAIVAFFLIAEHRAHILANTSYLLFAAFILLHFFMHAGHGGHGSHGGDGQHRHEQSEPDNPHQHL